MDPKNTERETNTKTPIIRTELDLCKAIEPILNEIEDMLNVLCPDLNAVKMREKIFLEVHSYTIKDCADFRTGLLLCLSELLFIAADIRFMLRAKIGK